MLVIDWRELVTSPFEKPGAVTCGVFDGVHRGHCALIKKITARQGLQSIVVTFKANPRFVLHPGHFFREIIPLKKKIMLLEEHGVDILVLIDFSLNFSKMDGVTFINTLVQNAKMRYLAIGKDFKCGSRGALHADAIVELCTALGIEAEIIPPVMDNGKPVSSSRIRAALSQNDYMLAEQLLGRRLNEPK